MKRAFITTYIIVFSFIFLLLLGGLLGFIIRELRIVDQKIDFEESLEIAESGALYYRWCLNNNIESNCTLERNFEDLSGETLGAYQIQPQNQTQCGIFQSSSVLSSGWTNRSPQMKRRVSISLGAESVAKYIYLLNSNVWIGSDHIIQGAYHSNGGIRFDGKNYSQVSSALNEWVCTGSFGCGPNGVGYGWGLCPPECKISNNSCVCPGVFSTTQNSNRSLFSFPVPQFDFNGITLDLNQAKILSQNSGGIYLPPSKNINGSAKGYHLIFKETGQLEVRIITGLSPTWAYSLEEGYHYDYFTITSEYFYRNFDVPTNCSLIFVEDNVWPEGKIRGKVTLISADLITSNIDTSGVLNANIEYTSLNGSDGFTFVAEKNILIGPVSPNYMTLRGIFIAQKGRFGRNHYPSNIKESLKIYGSVVSNLRVGTQWVNLGGNVVSGYLSRESYFDPYLLYSPPPFTPLISPSLKAIKWEEQ